MRTGVPGVVARAHERAAAAGFEHSCDPAVGRVLSVLAAAVRPGGRVLELGTGVGVGLAWLLHGVADRDDVEVVSVEIDEALHAQLRDERWPAPARCLLGDAVGLLPSLGAFDLIFADAQGGKWERLDLTIAALAPAGTLVVDDMTPATWASDEHRINTERVAAILLDHPYLAAAEVPVATGMVLAVKRV